MGGHDGSVEHDPALPTQPNYFLFIRLLLTNFNYFIEDIKFNVLFIINFCFSNIY